LEDTTSSLHGKFIQKFYDNPYFSKPNSSTILTIYEITEQHKKWVFDSGSLTEGSYHLSYLFYITVHSRLCVNGEIKNDITYNCYECPIG